MSQHDVYEREARDEAHEPRRQHAAGREPLSGVFRVQPQASVIERIDALTARMRSAVSLLNQSRPRDGRDD